MTRYDPEQLLFLMAQLEAQHTFEDGLIDPGDWEHFTAEEILMVARGETTIQNLVWGDATGSDREALAAQEQQRLAQWDPQLAERLAQADTDAEEEEEEGDRMTALSEANEPEQRHPQGDASP